VCSPGRHLDNDKEILELVATALEAKGHRVALAHAADAARAGAGVSMVFSMSRSPAALDLLGRWVAEGKDVINAPDAVTETARHRLARRSIGSVHQPFARVVQTAPALRGSLDVTLDERAWWVKGGDLYASRREDVQRVEAADELVRVLDDFHRRGVSTAVLQEHAAGREIKYYAAPGFFHWLDVGDAREPVTDATFKAAALGAGSALGLDIFGGDLILDDAGRATLIDLNDWPSFAPCRAAAALAIAAYLESRVGARYAASPSA
jgi:hypothetical protein